VGFHGGKEEAFGGTEVPVAAVGSEAQAQEGEPFGVKEVGVWLDGVGEISISGSGGPGVVASFDGNRVRGPQDIEPIRGDKVNPDD